MDRLKRHLKKQVVRWLADQAELEETLVDLDAGRLNGVPPEQRAALAGAIQSIAEAIRRLDTFNDDRPKPR